MSFSAPRIDPSEHEHLWKLLLNTFTGGDDSAPLAWLALKQSTVCHPIEHLERINLPKQGDVYFYMERSDEMYKSTPSDIINYISNLEPWIQIDAYIFDDSMSWLVVITHEDCFLTIGVEVI